MIGIQPGLIVEVILGGDEARNQTLSMQAMIYDIRGRMLIMSQTVPPMLKKYQGGEFLFSFLAKEKGMILRYGFTAKLTGFLTDYEMAAVKPVPALTMEMLSNPKPVDLRNGYRIKLMDNSGIGVILQGIQVKVVDISIGGARISTGRVLSLKPNSRINIKVTVDGTMLEIEGMVIRVWSESAAIMGNQQYATIKFITHQTERETLLGRKILFLERKMLTHGRL